MTLCSLPKNIKREIDRDLVANLKIEIPSSSHKRRKDTSFSCLLKTKKKSKYSMQGMNEKNAFAKVLCQKIVKS
jgi:hypothetical protein